MLALLPQFSRAANHPPALSIEISYTKHVLSNGLTLIVHEDHKAPIVGDRAKVEAGIRALNMGELHLLDVDGNAVRQFTISRKPFLMLVGGYGI